MVNQKVSDLEFLRKFKSKSTFTEEDSLKLGSEVNAKLAEKLLKKRGK